jgi:hypothetical protein
MRDMRVEDDLAANVEQNEGGVRISNCMLLAYFALIFFPYRNAGNVRRRAEKIDREE